MSPTRTPSAGRDALDALRHRRRAQRLRNLDWVDALYRAYVIGISSMAGLVMLAFVVGDRAIGARAVADVRSHGPAIAGGVVALLIAFGLRSGAHGGPLAFEAAEVHHVFLAPVDRGLVVRTSAYRQLRGVLAIGGFGGVVAGIAASPRIPSRSTGEWIAAGIAFGVAAALVAWGTALVASTRRMSQLFSLFVGLAVVAWSGADIAFRTSTSPATWVGQLALFPLRSSILAVAGFALSVVLVAVGLHRANNLSLEPVLTRAQLVRSLRFAATMQDLRAVINLRRQLAHEQSRARPWFRVSLAAPTGRASWRRDWHGIARWPGARITRVLVLAVVTGASSAAAVRGTTPLFAVAALAAYVIALDVVEGLAQEVDHPDRGNGIPMPVGDLYVAHLAAPGVLVAALGALGFGVGVLVAAAIPIPHGVHAVSPIVGAAVVLALAATAPTAGALSVYLSRPDRDLAVAMLNPRLVTAQQFAPLIVVALAFVPLIVAREVAPPANPVSAGLAAAAPALVVAFGIASFLRNRRTDLG